MIRLTDIDRRKTLALQLGERTGQDIHYSEVLSDGKYVYRHNSEYPDEVEMYVWPLCMCAEVDDDIPYDKSPFVDPNNFSRDSQRGVRGFSHEV
tara:strand:- start:339 stop:620 length:282 start_codon:yes stop_codon:yes gene_type:complete